jgi:hypothetical protein
MKSLHFLFGAQTLVILTVPAFAQTRPEAQR